MRILIVEDDHVSRLLMQSYLVPFGSCDMAVDGKEAVQAFELAWEEQKPYDLICLDIMMPELDGQEALKLIRESEQEKGIPEESWVKVIMTTALGDPGNINEAFRTHCEAYLVKPIEREQILEALQALRLID